MTIKTICSRCEIRKETVNTSGSFLCIECQDKQFSKVRKIVKERKDKMSIDLVKKHMDVGLKAKEIAEKTGLTVSTVYTYMSKIRQDMEKEEPKGNANGESTVTLEAYKKLELNYESLKTENNEYKRKNKFLSDTNKELINNIEKISKVKKEMEEEYDKLVLDYQDLSIKVASGVSTNNSEIVALQKIVSEFEDDNKTLRNRNEELSQEAHEELNKLRIELEIEKRKHRSLLDYVTAKAVR